MMTNLMRLNKSLLHTRTVLVLREDDSIWDPDAQSQVLEHAHALHTGLAQVGYSVIPIQIKNPAQVAEALEPFNRNEYIILNWFEGVEPNAEDGIQVLHELDRLGFTYTGSNALAWRMAQDRLRAKRILCAHAIPTPRWQELSEETLGDWAIYPAIIKVANDHGSEYLTTESVVYNAAQLRTRFEELRDRGVSNLMVAEYIDGREFTVALWGNGKIQSLPLTEVDFSALPPDVPRIRSFDAKWDPNSEAYRAIKLVPATDLAPALQDRIERVAQAAYRAFGLRDYGRVDIRLEEGTPYVIDVNANPDITIEGSFFAAAQLGGYTYPAMLDRIVRLAMERAA